jgi:hypothetical protein
MGQLTLIWTIFLSGASFEMLVDYILLFGAFMTSIPFKSLDSACAIFASMYLSDSMIIIINIVTLKILAVVNCAVVLFHVIAEPKELFRSLRSG